MPVPGPAEEASPPAKGRCRCGHLPTHHMLVRPLPGGLSFRLAPAGPCRICGETQCGRYTPAGTTA